MTYAGTDYWDNFHRRRREVGEDLDWGGLWLVPFRSSLCEVGAQTILELGCGTGNDAARLAREGYLVTALDFSEEAIQQAEAKFGSSVRFVIADMALPLPFPRSSFDAVMSNVALHMFPDDVTHSILAEVRRVVRPGGVFLLHVNALEDRKLRARKRPVHRELDRDFVLEVTGQTMHFFSESYLRDVLKHWRDVRLELVQIRDPETSEPFKAVWRVEAHR